MRFFKLWLLSSLWLVFSVKGYADKIDTLQIPCYYIQAHVADVQYVGSPIIFNEEGQWQVTGLTKTFWHKLFDNNVLKEWSSGLHGLMVNEGTWEQIISPTWKYAYESIFPCSDSLLQVIKRVKSKLFLGIRWDLRWAALNGKIAGMNSDAIAINASSIQDNLVKAGTAALVDLIKLARMYHYDEIKLHVVFHPVDNNINWYHLWQIFDVQTGTLLKSNEGWQSTDKL